MLIRRLSINSLILMGSNAGTAILAFALTLIIARGLGDEALGQYAAVMAWVLPLTLLVDFGFGSLITRNVAQSPALAHAYLNTGYRLRLIIGGLVIGLVWIVAPFLSDDPVIVEGLRIAVWLVLIDSLFANFTAVFRAWDMMWPILFLNIGLLALQVGGALIVVWQAWNVAALLACIVIADGIQLVATWLVWRWLRTRHQTIPVETSLLPVARLALPFMFAGILATLQMRGVIILLDQLENAQVVGWYAAASRIVEAGRLLPQAMFGALFPALSALVNHPADFRRVFRWALGMVTLYAVFGLLAAILLGEWLVVTLFGEAFRPSADVFTILMAALIFGLIRATLTLWFYAYHKEQLVNRLTLIAVLCQLVLGLILINRYGLLGAGWTVFMGEGVLVLMMGWAARQMNSFESSMNHAI